MSVVAVDDNPFEDASTGNCILNGNIANGPADHGDMLENKKAAAHFRPVEAQNRATRERQHSFRIVVWRWRATVQTEAQRLSRFCVSIRYFLTWQDSIPWPKSPRYPDLSIVK